MAHFLSSQMSIFTVSLRATFKLVFNTNNSNEEAAMWVLPLFVHQILPNALYSRMCAEDSFISMDGSERNQ